MRRLAQSGVKFLDQAGFTQPWLAEDQHQLPITLPRPLPASHEHGYFLVATDEWCEMALPSAASSAARADEAKQRHRLRYPLEVVAAALLGHEQPRDLALHPRRGHDRTRFGERLGTRRDIRHLAEYLTRRVDHHRSGVDGDACGERWFASAFVLAILLSERALYRECRPHGPLGIVLLCQGIAEQRHQPIAEFLGDFAAHFHDRSRSGIDICPDQVAPFLGIESCRDAGRIHQIAEHDRDMPAFAGSFG